MVEELRSVVPLEGRCSTARSPVDCGDHGRAIVTQATIAEGLATPGTVPARGLRRRKESAARLKGDCGIHSASPPRSVIQLKPLHIESQVTWLIVKQAAQLALTGAWVGR
jgi:hypothetical protein